MKKTIFSLLLCFMLIFGMSIVVNAADVAINDTNFPDVNFRQYVKDKFDDNEDGVLQDTEISAAESINVGNEGITTLKGIEFLTALTELECYENNLESLDISNNVPLEYLDCDDNELTSLDVSRNTALATLYCSGNKLESLNVSKNIALDELDCEDNDLTSLDVSKNVNLEFLGCNGNQLTSIDVSKNVNLIGLYCSRNKLTSLDVSKNLALKYLYCDSNQLTGLDVSKNDALVKLRCENNQLTSLDVSKNVALKELNCDDNKLTSLDVSQNTALTILNCSRNQLTSIDVSHLEGLDGHCVGNVYNWVNKATDFDLGQLPGNFNVNMVDLSSVTNGTFNVAENTFSFIDSNDPATYEYQCGLGGMLTFTLGYHSHSLTKVDSVPATCDTPGNIEYFICSGCGKLFKDEEGTQEITLADTILPAKNHDWNEVEYTWSEDGKTVVATRVCKRDSLHKETATTTNITSEQTKAPTTEAKGETTYTATFTESWAGTTQRVLEDIPKLVEQVENETTTNNTQENVVNNSQTLDNIMLYVIALVLSVIGIIASVIYVRKKK